MDAWKSETQNLAATPAQPAAPRNVDPGKYLTFTVGAEEFAVPVGKVKEIIGVQEITPVPQTPAFVKGVINLRGKVVPVLDLRIKLNAANAEYHQRTCIVVMQPQRDKGLYQIGVVVDGVSEVLHMQEQDIERTETFSHGLIQAGYILGVAKLRGKVKILLDIDTVLSHQELTDLDSLRHTRSN